MRAKRVLRKRVKNMTDAKSEHDPPVDARRIKNFALFFKSYMSVSTIVAAALPIPITARGVIPLFESQKGSLATYTPLACFLILSYVFYMRHSIGSVLFIHRHDSGARSHLLEMMPVILIFLCLAFIFSYHFALNASLQDLKHVFADEAAKRVASSDSPEDFNVLPDGTITFSGNWLLANVTYDKVTYGPILLLLYMGIFAAAEAAFVLMALREYLQEVIGLTDLKIMKAIMDKPKGDKKAPRGSPPATG